MDEMNFQFQVIIQELTTITGFEEFFQHYVSSMDETHSIENMLSSFREYRMENSQPLSEEETNILNQLQSRMLEICYIQNGRRLFFINDNQNLDHSAIDEFRDDWERAKTNRYSCKLRDRQTYKTVQEVFILEEFFDNGIMEKYAGNEHPLICQTIGSSLINGGFVRKGLPFLYKGVLYANNPHNRFWHSMYGVFGCTLSIWEFIRLYGLQKFKDQHYDYFKKLVKLLYLYLSRSIIFSEAKKVAQGHDFYRNRADLQRDHYSIMMSIFMESGFIADMEIQYLADCYKAYWLCSRLGVPGLGEQALWDSLKMYRYGSLNYFNEDNGAREREDDTWFQLVDRGTERANLVAEHILSDYIIGNIWIPEYIYEEMFVEIMNEHPDNPQMYEWHNKN